MPDRSVLCFGDSLTWGRDPENGGRLKAEDRWPGRLQQRLGSRVTILADGLPGRTAGPKDPRLPYPTDGSAQLALSLLINGPVDLLILMLGTNDLQDHLFKGIEETSNAIFDLVTSTRRPAPGRDWSPDVLLLAPPVQDIAAAAIHRPTFAGASGRVEALSDELQKTSGLMGVPCFEARRSRITVGADGVHLRSEQSSALGDAVADFLTSKKFRFC